MKHPKTLVLFNYDWDLAATQRLRDQWPHLAYGFDLFSFPSNARLAWFDMERMVNLLALLAKASGAKAVMSNHEQFGALCAALLAEKMGWPGTPVNAVLACQHKLYCREVLQRISPESNTEFQRLDAAYGGPVPSGLRYPLFVKPVKAAFSVLARVVHSEQELHSHTRFGPWELWVIRHLVEPFEKIIRKRIPQAGTAHSLMVEVPVKARQYSLDGYAFQGSIQALGVVDSIMYPGTSSFMRFDYPSQLPQPAQQRALEVARAFLTEIGFDHGLFNMEFFHDEATDRLTVIEFNPRMASQFSDLYARVDGLDLHDIAFRLAHGLDPATSPRKAPTAGASSSLVYRSLSAETPIHFPSESAKHQFARAFPDALFFEFKKDAQQIKRDFKWLESYRYGIVHLGGKDPEDLRARAFQASEILGWPAPYASAQHAPETGVSQPSTVSVGNF